MKFVMSLIGLVLLANAASACDYAVRAQAQCQVAAPQATLYVPPPQPVQLVYPAVRAYTPPPAFAPARAPVKLKAPRVPQRQQAPAYLAPAAVAPAPTGGVQQTTIINQAEQERRGLFRRLFNRR